MAILHAARGPQRDRLRSVTDPPIVEELLEMGAHRSVRDAQSLRDLLVGQAVRGQGQDLRLARRQSTRAKVGPAVPTRITVSETAHRCITRCVENNSATLRCAYL